MADAAEHANIPRRVAEELVELLVFAPVGLASTVIEELPSLVEKGRSRLTVARTIGQFAVVMGRQRIGQAVSERARRSQGDAPAEAPEHAGGKGTHRDAPAPHRHEAGAGDDDEPGGQGEKDADTVHERSGDGPDAAGLAIPGYDSLAASQVVQRLAGLSPDELEAVQRYEEATRGRRTILGRIAQLSTDRGEPEG